MRNILATALILIASTATGNEVDTRQILPLTEHQRDHVLTEMRALLSGTQSILNALSEENMTVVEREARALGVGMAHKGEDHLKVVLPKAFMQMGMSVHKTFDQIAADAESMKDPKHTLRQLSNVMQTCNACHASYQIRLKELSTGPETQSSHHPHQH
ncbi:MAG: hypothetical protein ABI284_02270 [Nitrosospira sp.]